MGPVNLWPHAADNYDAAKGPDDEREDPKLERGGLVGSTSEAIELSDVVSVRHDCARKV